jgi:DNA-directed RNA polymerase subunit RPC12/RpoP
MMSGTAPGKCADCGADAYIQLAVGDAMLCAHCYQDRLGLTKKVLGRKIGDPVIPKRISAQPRPT